MSEFIILETLSFFDLQYALNNLGNVVDLEQLQIGG